MIKNISRDCLRYICGRIVTGLKIIFGRLYANGRREDNELGAAFIAWPG
jgi:hypothetical protein